MGAAARGADVSRAFPSPDDWVGSVPWTGRRRLWIDEDDVLSGADARYIRDTILPLQDHVGRGSYQVEIIGREVEAWQHVRHGLFLRDSGEFVSFTFFWGWWRAFSSFSKIWRLHHTRDDALFFSSFSITASPTTSLYRRVIIVSSHKRTARAESILAIFPF